MEVSETGYILLSYDACTKTSIVIYWADNFTYLPPMQETRDRDFCCPFLGNMNLCENPCFVFLDGRLL